MGEEGGDDGKGELDGGGGDGEGDGGEGGGGGNGGGGGDKITQLGIKRAVWEPDDPGIEMDEVNAGAAPRVQTQHGSPSSRPLLWPSLSVSASAE